jgi:hypothetical protein
MGASIFAGIESTEYNLHMETKNIVRRSHLAKIPRIAELRDQAEEIDALTVRERQARQGEHRSAHCGASITRCGEVTES